MNGRHHHARLAYTLIGIYLAAQAFVLYLVATGMASDLAVDQLGDVTIYRASDEIRYGFGIAVVLHVVFIPVASFFRHWSLTIWLSIMLALWSLFCADSYLSHLRVTPEGFTKIRRPLLSDQDIDVKFDAVRTIQLSDDVDSTKAGTKRRDVIVVFADGERRTAQYIPFQACDQIVNFARARGLEVR